jgi:hypothetical protein
MSTGVEMQPPEIKPSTHSWLGGSGAWPGNPDPVGACGRAGTRSAGHDRASDRLTYLNEYRCAAHIGADNA